MPPPASVASMSSRACKPHTAAFTVPFCSISSPSEPDCAPAMLYDSVDVPLRDDSGLDDEPRCWVCLCSSQAGPLSLPCKCPNLYSHPACLARWQLQQAGKPEERLCRFCFSSLPPWPQMLIKGQKDIAISSSCAVVPDQSPPLAPITTIDVVFEQHLVRIPCFPGKEGAELFQRQVRHAFQLPDSVRLDVTFELETPAIDESQGETVWLNGFRYFEAAFQMANYAASRQGSAPHDQVRPPLSRAHSSPELYDIALLSTPGALISSLMELSTASMQHPSLPFTPAAPPSTVHVNSSTAQPQPCTAPAAPPASGLRARADSAPVPGRSEDAEDAGERTSSCYGQLLRVPSIGRLPSIKRWLSKTMSRSASAIKKWL